MKKKGPVVPPRRTRWKRPLEVHRKRRSGRAGEMPGAFRKFVFAVAFGYLVAIGTHFVRFGDDPVGEPSDFFH